MKITETIDKRIEKLILLRQSFMNEEEYVMANQVWARIQELKDLKQKFSDKDGNWLI